MRGVDLRIRAMLQQQFHQLDVARLRRAQERRRAVFEQPLHGEVGAGLGAIAGAFIRRRFRSADARVHVRALGDQQLDEIQVIHVGRPHRIIAAFDVAIIGGQIERRPSAIVRSVRICAMLQQILRPACSAGSASLPATASNRKRFAD